MREFRILGPLDVKRDGVPVELAGQRARLALVLLLLEGNRVVASDRLVHALWGESPPATAPTALRNVITQLRKALGADAIETRAPGYRLRVDDDSLDLHRVETALAAARSADGGEREQLLRRALAEWRGPPLPELRYADALQGELRRLDELRVAADEELLEAELAGPSAGELVPRLEALVADHPHRERLRGQLMLALYRGGRQADALQAYHDARRTLAEDLGLEPGPELRRLHGAILRQEAGLDRPRAAAAADPVDAHVRQVASALLAGRVVPVIAAAPDLATSLALRFGYPSGDPVEAARVAQYVATLEGPGPLHDELRELVDRHSEPTAVHRLFATLPPLLRARGVPHQLLVTTDYDGALERAFADAGEELDVVTYLAAGPNRGRFCHTSPDGSVRVIDDPSEYATELSLELRTAVLRVRGRVDAQPARDWESFVVTEDDHLDYLRAGDVGSGVPVALAAALRRSHFLFVGYAVRDWCLRLVLGRICTEAPLAYRSWAIAPEPGPTEEVMWRRFGVDLLRGDLEAYAHALGDAIGAAREVTA
jgi:DNA-binding SARP family transcriptional activator